MTPLRKLQLTELGILKAVTEYFDERNMPYVALGGTLLGAVRHKGFIPWDDDVDIGLPREYYEKFVSEAADFFDGVKSPYILRSHNTDGDYLYYFSRVCDDRTKVADNSALNAKETAAWIDVFPLDGMPSHRLAQAMHKLCLLKARMEFQYSRFDDLVNVNLKNRPFHERLLIAVGKVFSVSEMFPRDKAYAKLDKLLKKYPYGKSFYAVNFMGAGKFREMHPRGVYDARKKYVFEDTEIYSVSDADSWLKKMYGDYMIPPPEGERNKHFTEAE